MIAGQAVSASELAEMAEVQQLAGEWARETWLRLLQDLVEREWLQVYCCLRERCGELIPGANGEVYCSAACQAAQALDAERRRREHLAQRQQLRLLARWRAAVGA